VTDELLARLDLPPNVTFVRLVEDDDDQPPAGCPSARKNGCTGTR
jgi:hypothetical protein